MHTMIRLSLTLLAALCLAPHLPLQSQQAIDIDREKDGQAVPIYLSGFPSDTTQILTFDLEVIGFEVVKDKGKAQFQLSGSHSGALTGRLEDLVGKGTLLNRQYTQGKRRQQVHALSDDIARAALRQEGIAQTKIAFRGKVNGKWEIFISDYDGHNAQQVTQDRSVVAAPAWMPDQFRLYYTTYKTPSPNIVSHDLRTGKRTQITRLTGLNTSAALSPRGDRLAMILSRAGSPDLYIAQPDGTGLVRLAQSKAEEACPTWSPDGRNVCFTSAGRGGVRLYTVPTSGGSWKRLRTDGVGGMLTEPDWSPDGKWIAFTATMGKGNICVIPAQGGTAVPLTYGEDPCWAPNSRTVIFMRQKNGRKVLSLLDVPTKRIKDIRQFVSDQSQPSWRR